MCFVCMRCGRCKGVKPHEKVKEYFSNPHPCLKCGSKISKEDTKCPNCGEPVPKPAGQ